MNGGDFWVGNFPRARAARVANCKYGSTSCRCVALRRALYWTSIRCCLSLRYKVSCQLHQQKVTQWVTKRLKNHLQEKHTFPIVEHWTPSSPIPLAAAAARTPRRLVDRYTSSSESPRKHMCDEYLLRPQSQYPYLNDENYQLIRSWPPDIR